MRFQNLKDLVSLPYFHIHRDNLYLKKGIFPYEIFDMHTHLGWHYLMTPPLDLWKTGKVKHFFPSNIPFDLERYTAYDFTEAARKKCEHEVMRGAYDIHGYSSTHTIPNILAEMDRLGIGHATVLAIDYPLVSQNSREQLWAIERHPKTKKRLSMYVSLHPLQLNKEQFLKQYLLQGAKGIKLHPQMQLYRPSVRTAYPIYELAGKYHLPILFHTGLSPISPSWQKRFVQPKDYETVFADFPKTTFIIGHGGGAEGYEWAASMACRHKHIYIELSGQPPRGIEHILKHVDSDRIVYGSDWPFYPMALPLAKALVATEKYKKIRKKIFRENAARLLRS